MSIMPRLTAIVQLQEKRRMVGIAGCGLHNIRFVALG